MNSFRSLLLVFAVIAGLNLASCRDEDDEECTKGYKPDECVESKPDSGMLKIRVTINALNPSVAITVYNGDFEENKAVFTDELDRAERDYYMKNRYYSVKATYQAIIDGRQVTVNAIDGGDLDADTEEYCDGNCYSEGEVTLEPLLDL
jgi:hypothetical protein